MFLIQLDTATYRVIAVTAVAEAGMRSRLDDSYLLNDVAPTIGEVFDPVTRLFGAPNRRRWITKLAFRQRLTSTERVALKQAQLLPTRLAEETDTDYAVRCTLPMQLQDMDDLLTDATYIDLDRADTRQMVQSLEQLGLLAAGRAAVVLDDPITPHEYFPEA